MADQREHQTLRLAGYESWLYQMPCVDSAGDVFVSVSLAGHTELSGNLPACSLVALGDVSGRGEAASRLKDSLEAEVTRLLGATSDPAAILEALNNDPVDPNSFACLLVAVIDSDRHELILANAGHAPPLLRHADRQTELLGERMSGFPLWLDSSLPYDNVTVPIGPGEMVVFHSVGVTAVTDHQGCLFDLKRLRQAIAQASDDAASVGQSILKAIDRFRGGRAQVDDITLLCLGRVPTTLIGREASR
jgi:sigma-B regulation protein RsbU (phosphoserine phosphatase)